MSYKHKQLIMKLKEEHRMNFNSYDLDDYRLEMIIHCFNHLYAEYGPDIQPYHFEGFYPPSYIPKHIVNQLYEAYKETERYYNQQLNYYYPISATPIWEKEGFENEYRWKAAIDKQYNDLESMEENLKKALLIENNLKEEIDPLGFDDFDDFAEDDELNDNDLVTNTLGTIDETIEEEIDSFDSFNLDEDNDDLLEPPLTEITDTENQPRWKIEGFANEYRFRAEMARQNGRIDEMEYNMKKAVLFEKQPEQECVEILKLERSAKENRENIDDIDLFDSNKNDDIEENNLFETTPTETDEEDKLEGIAIDDDEEPFTEDNFTEDENEITDEELKLLSDLEEDNPFE